VTDDIRIHLAQYVGQILTAGECPLCDMSLTDRLPDANRTRLPRALALLVGVSTLLGAAHHVDHVVRGNHVGWPITTAVNPFTYSLVIYPLVAVGLYLTLTDRESTRYWALLFPFSAGMLAFFHLSPWAVEPPSDVVLPYANPLYGYLAFAVLLALIASVVVASAYAILVWRRTH